jgi:hypothetical protein
MINVLPEVGRARARKEYFLRLGTLAGIAVGVSFLLASMALFPIYLAAREKKEIIEKELIVAEDAAKREAESIVGKDIAAAAEALPFLEKKMNALRPSLYMQEILEAQDETILLSRLDFQAGTEPTIRISGEAARREGLIAFSRRLSQLRGAPRVDLPVSNLAKSEEVPFTITLYFKP